MSTSGRTKASLPRAIRLGTCALLISIAFLTVNHLPLLWRLLWS